MVHRILTFKYASQIFDVLSLYLFIYSFNYLFIYSLIYFFNIFEIEIKMYLYIHFPYLKQHPGSASGVQTGG